MRLLITAILTAALLLQCIEADKKKPATSITNQKPKLKKYREETANNAEGERLYKQHCVRCHPAPSELGLPVPPKMTPAPRDFITGGLKYGDTLAAIERNITNGIEGTQMPSFGGKLQPQQISALANYVRSLSSLYALEVEEEKSTRKL